MKGGKLVFRLSRGKAIIDNWSIMSSCQNAFRVFVTFRDFILCFILNSFVFRPSALTMQKYSYRYCHLKSCHYCQACVFGTWGPIAQSAKFAFCWTDADVGFKVSKPSSESSLSSSVIIGQPWANAVVALSHHH